MAGTEENKFQENEDSFQWDEQSQLYYHASSGFYHDSCAGWYYSSKDGHYYKFENGNYVLWETDQHAPCDKDANDVNFEDGEIEGCVAGDVTPIEPIVDTECPTEALCENMPPPSEWLEDTLIELYLSGYSNQTTDGASGARALNDDLSLNISTDVVDNDNADELEEGEWVPDESHEAVDGCGVASDEDAFAEEEMWRAQYGQTVHLDKVCVPDYPVVDLWDWAMINETKRRKRKICRLVGRLVKRTTKLHPSMPASGRVLKTAPICEVYLDLVRVRSGKVYKLRSPKIAYLASVLSYDSSNPTKDWGFPKLSIEKATGFHIESKRKGAHVEEIESLNELSKSAEEHSSSEKNKGNIYRDRAAERRTLHGGFGVGPGQKKSTDGVDSASSLSPVSASNTEEAAAEALEMSFGVGSYARRLLKNMGWKEGEALGSSMKGLTEPLQAVGNKGSSGLGWNHDTRWNRI
ncbi:uncharacterized protein [Rutidosis leptorrhynchoides]|uniref:uncharacterized protein isoform X2 n=1 Tax=Rutidosis leptorrhynchoides TaxID=125765 RepID=UPI003A9A5302